MLLIRFIVSHSPPQSPVVTHAKMSYLAGPTVLHNDGRPEVSRTGVDCILPSPPVQGSWKSPRRALRGPRTVEDTDLSQSRAERLLFRCVFFP